MKKMTWFLLLAFLLSACGDSTSITNEDLSGYEVNRTFDAKEEDEFMFRLYSEKEAYMEGEEIKLYGEITYTGEEAITISHAASAVVFTIREQVRDYTVTSAVPEIGTFTELTPNQAYREKYSKQGVAYSETDEQDYIDFMDDLIHMEGFPPGYYVVEAMTAFHDGTTHREIPAQIDFMVLPEE